MGRSPRAYLVAGWIVFLLGCYPGYLSVDSTLQLGQVRSGVITDTYAASMTAVWTLLELVLSGPLPMLLLQSGLVLFGLYALLRRVTSPRAAAIAASIVLVFPPVAAPLGVIWRDSLLAGCLVGGLAAAFALREAVGRRRIAWGVACAALGALACSCRPEAAVAIAPLAWLAAGSKRAAVTAALACALLGRGADELVTDQVTFARRQDTMLVDLVGTLRRSGITDNAVLADDLVRMNITVPGQLADRIGRRLDPYSITHGDRRVFEPITTEHEKARLAATWRHVIATHPGAYLSHRWSIARALLGLRGRPDPVYASFGDPALIGPLSHRARPSDWQRVSQPITRAVAATPLFRPWLYLLLAIGVLVGAGRLLPTQRPARLLARVLATSALAHEVLMVVLAPAPDYRFSLWLVAATCAALAVIITARRWAPSTEARPPWHWELTPRAIVIGSYVTFLLYCYPGFLGWDTREHLVNERTGVYLDGHPPAVARLFRLCEVFVSGPALVLLLQSALMLFGLHAVFKRALAPRAAAIAAGACFLFPPISGVTGLVGKDSLMAGCILMGIGCLLDERPRVHRVALAWMFAATLMRWNALAATAAPVTLLFVWRPTITGWRRYAIAIAAWFAVTVGSYATNELLRTKHEYLWYSSHAYQDIAGTLQYMPPQDDAAMEKLLAGVPLRTHDLIHAQLRARYNPADYRHLSWGETRLLDIPDSDAEREAIARAWNEIVLGHPAAYAQYRIDNYRLLLRIDRPYSFSNVYVWFHVLAAPEVIDELQHDAYPSRLQSLLIRAQIWIGWTPLYFTFLYFGLCFVLLPFVRSRLAASIVLSAIGYQLAWFVLAPTTDFRYSQWMMLCSLVGVTLVAYARRTGARTAAATTAAATTAATTTASRVAIDDGSAERDALD